MLEFARWKYIVAALVLVIATVYSLPNLFPQDSAVQISANRGNVVDTALRERVQGVLEAGKIGFKRIDLEGDSLLVRLADPSAQIHAADAVRAELGNGYVVDFRMNKVCAAGTGKAPVCQRPVDHCLYRESLSRRCRRCDPLP